jgi:hypothetical protein
MRNTLVMAAAALLFTGSAQAAASPVQASPAAFRLKSGNPQAHEPQTATWHATLTGSFFDKTGRYYTVTGEGDFIPTFGPSSTQVRYSAQLIPVGGGELNFGMLQGNGVTQGAGSADQARFDVVGAPSESGYRLNVSGNFVNGHIDGSFALEGNGGIGGGEFTGHP